MSRSSGAGSDAGPGEDARRRSPSGSSSPGPPSGTRGDTRYPAGSRKGCFWSTPSSTTATFTPRRRPPWPRQRGRADHACTVVHRHRVAVGSGRRVRTRVRRSRLGSSAAGRSTKTRRGGAGTGGRTLAEGICSPEREIAPAWAPAIHASYARQERRRDVELRRPSRRTHCRRAPSRVAGSDREIIRSRSRPPCGRHGRSARLPEQRDRSSNSLRERAGARPRRSLRRRARGRVPRSSEATNEARTVAASQKEAATDLCGGRYLTFAVNGRVSVLPSNVILIVPRIVLPFAFAGAWKTHVACPPTNFSDFGFSVLVPTLRRAVDLSVDDRRSRVRARRGHADARTSCPPSAMRGSSSPSSRRASRARS